MGFQSKINEALQTVAFSRGFQELKKGVQQQQKQSQTKKLQNEALDGKTLTPEQKKAYEKAINKMTKDYNAKQIKAQRKTLQEEKQQTKLPLIQGGKSGESMGPNVLPSYANTTNGNEHSLGVTIGKMNQKQNFEETKKILQNPEKAAEEMAQNLQAQAQLPAKKEEEPKKEEVLEAIPISKEEFEKEAATSTEAKEIPPRVRTTEISNEEAKKLLNQTLAREQLKKDLAEAAKKGVS